MELKPGDRIKGDSMYRYKRRTGVVVEYPEGRWVKVKWDGGKKCSSVQIIMINRA